MHKEALTSLIHFFTNP